MLIDVSSCFNCPFKFESIQLYMMPSLFPKLILVRPVLIYAASAFTR